MPKIQFITYVQQTKRVFLRPIVFLLKKKIKLATFKFGFNVVSNTFTFDNFKTNERKTNKKLKYHDKNCVATSVLMCLCDSNSLRSI